MDQALDFPGEEEKTHVMASTIISEDNYFQQMLSKLTN